jgi:hypothetical protein
LNTPTSKTPAVLNAAVQRVKATFRATLDRCVETMAAAASTASRTADREALRVAMFELGRRQASFAMTFNERLDDSVSSEMRRLEGNTTSALPRETSGATFWETLTLVSHSETELEVAGERIAQALAHDCEWELRRLDALMLGALRTVAVAAEARNPLRPDVIGKAVAAACAGVSDDAAVNAAVRTHMTRAWTTSAAAMYKDMADAMQQAGVRPADVNVRTVQGPGNEMGTSTYQAGVHGGSHTPVGVTSMMPNDLTRQLAQYQGAPWARGGSGGGGSGGGGGGGGGGDGGSDQQTSGYRASGYHNSGPGRLSTDAARGGGGGGGSSGVGGDSRLNTLTPSSGLGAAPGGMGHGGGGLGTGRGGGSAGWAILGELQGGGGGGISAGTSTGGPGGDGNAWSPGTHGHGGDGGRGTHAQQGISAPSDAQLVALLKRLAMFNAVDRTGPSATTLQGDGALSSRPGVLPNVIASHRDELRQAATGALDHMVIDVVASLFDQILSDAKVPPQMARQIARLQLPVLRVALIDTSFFSSRRHPVRRFVNRIASLAVAFDDFGVGPGQKFHEMVRSLVDEIVSGDFDQMQQYQQKLAALEEFAADEAKSDAESVHRAPSLLDHREAELLLQQRYVQQLRAGLATAQMDDYLRDFITQVWSQSLMRVGLRHGPQSGMLKTLRATGRDLVLSVQPKGSPADRKAFLVRLPQLMKELDVGLGLIGWPDDARRDFVAKLRASQATALNQPPMRVLDYNLLSKQLEAVLATPLPSADQAPQGVSAQPILEARSTPAFTKDEAQRIGLFDETTVNWDGTVDIDVGAAEEGGEETSLTELDINIDGLPPAEPMEPTRGAALMDHVQVGFSYRMHFENRWHKARLAHISPGRTFFVFTHGAQHEHAISMTARMLARLCESGRLRAYENAHLIERATARARKQLAAIRAGTENTAQAALNSQH